jgi:hypothetical protein
MSRDRWSPHPCGTRRSPVAASTTRDSRCTSGAVTSGFLSPCPAACPTAPAGHRGACRAPSPAPTPSSWPPTAPSPGSRRLGRGVGRLPGGRQRLLRRLPRERIAQHGWRAAPRPACSALSSVGARPPSAAPRTGPWPPGRTAADPRTPTAIPEARSTTSTWLSVMSSVLRFQHPAAVQLEAAPPFTVPQRHLQGSLSARQVLGDGQRRTRPHRHGRPPGRRCAWRCRPTGCWPLVPGCCT